MYRGMTDGAAHFESGSCQSCLGGENARKAAYQLVKGQAGGSSFLANPLMLTMNGYSDGGYSADGPNYKCPGCEKTFSMLSSLMQHTQNRPQCLSRGEHVNLRIGGPQSSSSQQQPQMMKFFHGTTWEKANQIQRQGFLPSENGCLGRGVYVAREDKATRFARQRANETYASYGGLVELLVTVRNPKYVLQNDGVWQQQGYDACRAERTTASTNMEWCILDPSQIEVIRVTAVTA